LITAVIVDAEPSARAHLRRELETQGVAIAGEAVNNSCILQMVETLHPDVITLDLQTLGQTGMQMATTLLHLHRPPLLVFIAGHSEYAATAFEYEALDYLIKPVAPERLAKTLVRARERLAARRPPQRAAERLRLLPVRGEYKVRLLKVAEILFATARDKKVFACTAEGEYRLQHTLAQLEQMLPADRFLRIHDSWLVNLERVEELLFLGNHAYMVRLENKVQAPVGRTRYAELQRRLGLSAVPMP
jgi:DNA-binding LytR/AlgR family response regulator